MLFILECEMFIKYVAADAAKEVVRGRRYPIAESKYIIEYKHNGSTYYGIYHSNNDKLHEGLVGKQSDFIF
jgi:hypothetical protein